MHWDMSKLEGTNIVKGSLQMIMRTEQIVQSNIDL